MFVTLMPCLFVLLCGPKIRNKDSCILLISIIVYCDLSEIEITPDNDKVNV